MRGLFAAGVLFGLQGALLVVPPCAAEEAVSTDVAALAGDTVDEEGAAEPLRLSMEFQDAMLKDVLKAFSQQTGINVIAAAELGEQPVTIYFEDVAALDALDQILAAGNLTYARPPGSEIYIVKPAAGQEPEEMITRVYGLKYARVSQSVLAKAASALNARTPFEASVKAPAGSGTGTTGGQIGGQTGGATEEGVDAILKKLLTAGGYVVVDSRTNRLIVTDVPSNFPRIEAVLAALDVRTPQIMVDAEIIETTLNKLKDLGIEWGTGSEGDLIKFTPGSAGRETRFPFNVFGRRLQPTGATHFPTSTLSFNSFQGVLQALEKDTDTKILARPKVLTLDNESALIRLTSDEAIGFEVQTGEQTATTSSEPERITTGIILVVTPQVNEDGYITMIVEPSVTKTVASQISPPAGQAQPRDPKTRSSRTLVRIRDGDTLVVGGLIDRTEEETLRRVPILSGIPFLGEAFKNTEVNNTASELIVFVTPRILADAPGTRMTSAGLPDMPRGAAAAGHVPWGAREQESGASHQELIEQTLNRLEQPTL